MVSVSRILSGRFRRSLRDTLFLFLSEHRLWFMLPESGCTEFHDNSPLTVTTVMERLDACRREHTFSRLAVLPEFPWIWTRFEQVIPLKRDELLAYVQGRLQFVPNLNNRDSSEEIGAWQPVDPAYPTVKVGAVFLRQNRGDRIGLFTAVMSPKSMELDRSCKLRFGKNVAWVPLLAVCLPRLSTADRETILFKTLERWHFLE